MDQLAVVNQSINRSAVVVRATEFNEIFHHLLWTVITVFDFSCFQMSMWDELMSTFHFPPDPQHSQSRPPPSNHHSHAPAVSALSLQQHSASDSSPSSHPCSPGIPSLAHHSTAPYIFPPLVMPATGRPHGEGRGEASRAGVGTGTGAATSTRSASLQRLNDAHIDSKDGFAVDMDAGLTPYLRPRVYTWAQASPQPTLSTSPAIVEDDFVPGEFKGSIINRLID